MEKRNCECCLASYGTGKNYGDFWCEIPGYKDGKIINPKGLCEFCNVNNKSFCCKKHNASFRIGNYIYDHTNNFEKVYSPLTIDA